MAQPRLLQTLEISGFLARHPVIAARVAITRAGMAAGIYDINAYDLWAEWGVIRLRFPGVIEPRGLQVEDSVYGLVTIQPAPTGIYFSGWSPVIGDAEKAEFESPSGNNPLLDLQHLALMLAAGMTLVYLGGKALEGRNR